MAKIVTITNPLTGQPAQVDQLDHTAQQIDDGLNIARGVSNPSLIDNGVFLPGCLVDQRGGYVTVATATGYFDENCTNAGAAIGGVFKATKIANGNYTYQFNNVGDYFYCKASDVVRGYTGGFFYTIDRWKLEDSTGKGVVLINDDGSITIKNPEGNTDNVWWTQYRETDFSGEQCTISVLATEASGGAVYTGANNLGAILQQGMTTITGVPTGNMAARIVVSPGNAVTVRGIKLELGDTQTLAHQDADGNWVLNEIPNYADTLARCQRYFVNLTSTADYYYPATGVTVNGRCYFAVTVPVTMRGVPSVVNLGGTMETEIYGDGSMISVFDAQVNDSIGNQIRGSCSSTLQNSTNYVQFKHLGLTADL